MYQGSFWKEQLLTKLADARLNEERALADLHLAINRLITATESRVCAQDAYQESLKPE